MISSSKNVRVTNVMSVLSIVLGSLAVFSNFMGILSYFFVGFGEGINPNQVSFLL